MLFDNNDIEIYFKLYLLLYAADTVVFAETAVELQSALNATYLYCETWKLKVNAAKINVVFFFLKIGKEKMSILCIIMKGYKL